MEIRYCINRYPSMKGGLISRVEIEKETKEFVFLPAIPAPKGESWGGQRARREHKAGNYFATFEEAKAELVKRCEKDVQYADDKRSRAIQALGLARVFELPK